MCSLDLEVCPVWNERPRLARKVHYCYCCGTAIVTGETYLYHSSVFGHTARSEKMCAVCWLLREDFAQAHGQACMPSDFLAMLRECAGEERGSEWRLLLAVILRRVRAAERVH
jgi:hypothetical protein